MRGRSTGATAAAASAIGGARTRARRGGERRAGGVSVGRVRQRSGGDAEGGRGAEREQEEREVITWQLACARARLLSS